EVSERDREQQVGQQEHDVGPAPPHHGGGEGPVDVRKSAHASRFFRAIAPAASASTTQTDTISQPAAVLMCPFQMSRNGPPGVSTRAMVSPALPSRVTR